MLRFQDLHDTALYNKNDYFTLEKALKNDVKFGNKVWDYKDLIVFVEKDNNNKLYSIKYYDIDKNKIDNFLLEHTYFNSYSEAVNFADELYETHEKRLNL